EGLINAVACQQVSLQVGILLLNRLCRACEGDSGGLHQTLPFPTPQRLLEQEPELLRSLGFSRQKVRSLRAVAEAARAGDLDERAWQGMPAEAIRERLTQIPGIGRWSAEYVLLRALGRLDIFPGDDVGGRKGLLRWLGAEARAVGYEDTLAHLKAWAPFAGMVYFFMLLRRLEEAGYIA
ncbi:DNA-3-methyladenine glycosylase 2 family protein, partial [Acidithiobacillus caldus]|nr:DNA-3-methyladenine glycosylase 2 family protein [Acidithiobacillus caldus]